MNSLLIPERFGCGLKLDFGELVTLRRDLGRPFGADAAAVDGVEPETLSSIDRVFQVGVSSRDFCRLALRHATADLTASGATATFVSASFEFGGDLDRNGRSDLTEAFFAAADERDIKVGKCHSSTAPVTSLTLTVEGPVTARFRPIQGEGSIMLVGALGGLEQLYRRALESSAGPVDTVSGFNPHQGVILESASTAFFATDVSGYGLAGAIWEFALSGPVDVRLDPGAIEDLVRSQDADVPPCLYADLGAYGLPELSARAHAIFARREFCGPFLLACSAGETETLAARLLSHGAPATLLARFRPGTSEVSLQS